MPVASRAEPKPCTEQQRPDIRGQQTRQPDRRTGWVASPPPRSGALAPVGGRRGPIPASCWAPPTRQVSSLMGGYSKVGISCLRTVSRSHHEGPRCENSCHFVFFFFFVKGTHRQQHYFPGTTAAGFRLPDDCRLHQNEQTNKHSLSHLHQHDQHHHHHHSTHDTTTSLYWSSPAFVSRRQRQRQRQLSYQRQTPGTHTQNTPTASASLVRSNPTPGRVDSVEGGGSKPGYWAFWPFALFPGSRHTHTHAHTLTVRRLVCFDSSFGGARGGAQGSDTD